MAGTMTAVLSALYRMLARLLQQGATSTAPACPLLRLLIPDDVCGHYIGQNGDNIRALSEESGAQISVSKKEPVPHGGRPHCGSRERIVCVSGTVAQTIRAVGLSLCKLAANPRYLNNPLLGKLAYPRAPQPSGAPPVSTCETNFSVLWLRVAFNGGPCADCGHCRIN